LSAARCHPTTDGARRSLPQRQLRTRHTSHPRDGVRTVVELPSRHRRNRELGAEQFAMMTAREIVPHASLRNRIDELRRTYESKRRLVIERLMDDEMADAIAADLRRAPFVPAVNVPIEGERRPPPRFWGHHAILEVDPRSPRSLAHAFVLSLTRGPLRDFIGAVTDNVELDNHVGGGRRPALVAHAYPRGGYLEEHADDAVDGGERRAVALVWHASPRWEPSWGGGLHFFSPEETLSPAFNALHLFEARAHNRHEITMVTGSAVRYTLSGWLYERRKTLFGIKSRR
jgi:hypothetical protein